MLCQTGALFFYLHSSLYKMIVKFFEDSVGLFWENHSKFGTNTQDFYLYFIYRLKVSAFAHIV